jgi:hypothetical protein
MSLGDSLDFFTRLSGTAVAHSFDAFWRSLNSDNPLDVNTTPIKSSLSELYSHLLHATFPPWRESLRR